MPTAVIAVPDDSEFTFDPEALAAAFRGRWPDAAFVPATGRIAAITLGQWQIPHPHAYPDVVVVDVDVEGRSLAFDSLEDELRADAIATATTVPGFPDDGTVVLAEWSRDFIPLRPSTSATALLSHL